MDNRACKSLILRSISFSLLIAFLFLSTSCKTTTSLNDEDFNNDWLFLKGNVSDAKQFGFNDSEWRKVDLPHDWAIEGPFSIENNARTGGLPVHGTGWYRKHFQISKENSDKIISVEFDGAMNNAHVWVNGHFAGNRPYGYIGFEFDITPFIKFGEQNVIAVRLSPKDLSARWYPGAGIYRNVRIKTNYKLHIPQWGTKITTQNVSKSHAKINFTTSVCNKFKTQQSAELETSIVNSDGEIVSTITSEIILQANTTGYVDQLIDIENPKIWDIKHPNLYKSLSKISIQGKIIDSYESEFGVRTIKFTTENGFQLNGKTVKLQGVCMHHDLGPLGAAVNYRATERQMQIMKSMGVNALRTSHNPPSPELLQICDKLGIVVIVEAFDEWKLGKVINGYNKYFDEWHEKDLRDMIKRDRNHPSVIMWSIGNEILEQSRKDGWKIAKELTEICHEEDSTRPTTAGFNYYPAPFTNQLAKYVDIVGMNYWPLNYQEILDANPNMIVYGSETSSQTSSRGVYHFPIEANEQHQTNQVSSYDGTVGPPWAYAPDVEFEQQEKVTRSLGEFMWTGFDYLGEPTPYGGKDNSTNGYWNTDWPSRSSYFAPVDLCGFPKDRYYLYQSQWTTKPMVHVLPHWNWEGKEGDTIPVYSYTNCDEVELFVNGKSFGKKIKGVDLTPIPAEFHFFPKGMYQSKYRLSWDVPYQAGTLKVVAYKNGKIEAEKTIHTAGKAYQIKLIPDRKTISADGKDLSFITVRVEDKDGNLCPKANDLVKFSIEGKGEIVAVGNGDATSTKAYQAKKRNAFNGLCLLIVKSTTIAGEITINAESDQLITNEISISTKK
ncbi:beta-galactosidase GalB [Labilibaculum antarcticum]|uniref:Glycoside hydrolase n=1 Tax=Labilibaculum antarcticum TaxID=1717717 RepID=A0A1Y1CDR0_9BACT|nr:beta-galactosidase GalB [Labilibaculum antarcticum]BAX78488.1 glycoside hydrolase [Labilibaculum antarcticum]